MAKTNFNFIHNNLTYDLQTYIKAIVEEYGTYMSEYQLDKLKNIKDYNEIIKIHDYGSINGYANRTAINMPLSVDKVFDIVSKIPGYGINKKHMPYNKKNMIINDNTFFTYIMHVFVSGKDTEAYYKDLLLHETMHFCGSGGARAITEGFNELLTRKIALKKGFKTSGCGYPKEVAVAYELQNVFGEEVVNKLAFINNPIQQCEYLGNSLGANARDLYLNISNAMEQEFQSKYYNHMDSYNGLVGILKKTINYRKIDYSDVYNMIYEYKKSEQSVINKSK